MMAFGWRVTQDLAQLWSTSEILCKDGHQMFLNQQYVFVLQPKILFPREQPSKLTVPNISMKGIRICLINIFTKIISSHVIFHRRDLNFVHILLIQKHRVRVTKDEVKSSRLRRSIAYFTHPDLGTKVECLHNTNKYAPVDGNEYIHSRTNEVYTQLSSDHEACVHTCTVCPESVGVESGCKE